MSIRFLVPRRVANELLKHTPTFCWLYIIFLIEFEIYETNAPEFSRIFSKFSKAKIHSPLASQYELSR